ncbi:MAG: prolipoprotein diacylglyceryl transferase [Deltaproteobacteria bacterium]|nr:prolipoprotein diacylglyceryl transferase [Deltaproteobacteria bacterium]
MHPVLFHIPWIDFPVRLYGIMMAVGFLVGLSWVRFQSKRINLSPDKMTDFAFLMMFSGVAGARIASVVIEGNGSWKNPLAYFRVWEGGLVFYGGLIAGLLVAFYYCYKKKISFLKISDLFMPAVAIGLGIGRIGCLMAGCCHGKVCPTDAWYGIIYPEGVGSQASPLGVPLYPTPIMEAVSLLFIFIFLAWYSQRKKFDGQILSLYLMIYAIVRSYIELFRGDVERKFVPGTPISTSQMISIILFVVGLGIYFKYRKQGRQS